jgi:hypothetical protein
MSISKFSGPLFILGVPRSGTTLLRSLLNQHPNIGIAQAEGHFLPRLVNQFDDSPDLLLDRDRFSRFYQAFSCTGFFLKMKQQGLILSEDMLFHSADLGSWCSIFEVVFRFYAPMNKREGFIWGDKIASFSYMDRMAWLKSIFPQARFLHIVETLVMFVFR